MWARGWLGGMVMGAMLFIGTADWAAAVEERPNIVRVIVEDMSADFGCYGETSIETPEVDRLAAEGIRFSDAVVTAPVCSACRSALVTGMYQTSIGAHHHRSGRGEEKIDLPEGVELVPALFQRAGYQTANLSFEDFVKSDADVAKDPSVRITKTDYNFEWDTSVYETTHWTRRKEGQPFFVQVQLRGGKLRGKGDGDAWPAKVEKALGSSTPSEDVELPPYLPEDPVIVEDWRQYLDTVRYTDWELGRIVARLKDAGEWERTVVFFMTDHGISHVRNKQFLYEGGMHVPLVIAGGGIAAGEVREDPVEHIDLAATSLALAGIEIPEEMQSRDILAADYEPREFVFSARDRCDETVDRMRAVRSTRFKYIRNFLPDRPYLQANAYKDAKPIVQAMRRLAEADALDTAQRLIMAPSRPSEELYDLAADPYELHNLAGDAAHREQLLAMRDALARWIEETGDLGQLPESEAMYDSDMAMYLTPARRRRPGYAATVEANIAWMKEQAAKERAAAE